MTSTAQRQELQNKIWKIANEVRGAVDGWDFKQFVLGALFYRFISENFSRHFDFEDSVYADLPDTIITPDIKDDAVKTKGKTKTEASNAFIDSFSYFGTA